MILMLKLGSSTGDPHENSWKETRLMMANEHCTLENPQNISVMHDTVSAGNHQPYAYLLCPCHTTGTIKYSNECSSDPPVVSHSLMHETSPQDWPPSRITWLLFAQASTHLLPTQPAFLACDQKHMVLPTVSSAKMLSCRLRPGTSSSAYMSELQALHLHTQVCAVWDGSALSSYFQKRPLG